MFSLSDFIIFSLSTCKSGKCWVLCEIKEINFGTAKEAQTTCVSAREGGTISACVTEIADSNPHPARAKGEGFHNNTREKATGTVCSTPQKHKSEILQDGKAPTWS